METPQRPSSPTEAFVRTDGPGAGHFACSASRSRCERQDVADSGAERDSDIEVAWGADNGVSRFTECFKYVIATSFLLTSTPTIIEKCTPQHEDEPVSMRNAPENAIPVEGKVAGDISPLPVLDVSVLGVLAACIRIPPRYLLLAVAGIVLCLCFDDVSMYLGATPRVSYTLGHAPNDRSPHFLARGIPNPSWVADERARLQAAALRNVKQLVDEAHALDYKISEALSAVQEVELVSRGYSLSRPLAPISRIEAAAPGKLSVDEGPVPMQRLTKIRVALSHAMEEMEGRCRRLKAGLSELVDETELDLLHEIDAVNPLPSAMDHHISPRPADSRLSATPRMLALTPQATPKRRSQPRASDSIADELMIPFSPTIRTPNRPTSDDSLLLDNGRPSARLTIAELRSRFECMHRERRSVLYHLLSLHFVMKSPMPGGASMSGYWEGVVDMLASAADTMQECRSNIAHSIADTMAPDVHLPPQSSRDALHEHPVLIDRVSEMARMLRAIQCKLHVFSEDLALGEPRCMHGVRSEYGTKPSNQEPRSLFDSIRSELLALSTEWEESLRIIDAANEPAEECTLEPSSSEITRPEVHSPPAVPQTPTRDDHGPVLFATETDVEHDEHIQPLADISTDLSTNARAEEVFETVSAKQPARPRLSRAERIKQMHDDRAHKPPENIPLAMISELRGIIASKHPERGDSPAAAPVSPLL